MKENCFSIPQVKWVLGALSHLGFVYNNGASDFARALDEAFSRWLKKGLRKDHEFICDLILDAELLYSVRY